MPALPPLVVCFDDTFVGGKANVTVNVCNSCPVCAIAGPPLASVDAARHRAGHVLVVVGRASG